MGYDERTWGVGQWLAVSATGLLLLGLLIALAVWVASSRHGGQRLQGGGPGDGSDAQDLLAERYARGDIDEKDFLRRREQLRGGVNPPMRRR